MEAGLLPTAFYQGQLRIVESALIKWADLSAELPATRLNLS